MVAGKPGPVRLDRYRDALAQRDPVASMAQAPARYRKLLKGFSERELTRRPAPGKWSIKEVLAHLADSEIVLGARLRFVAAMKRPAIVGYDQDAFVEHLGIEKVDTAHLVAAFDAARALNVALLRRLPKSAWKRVGVHSERGEESLDAMVRMFAGHDLVHEAQIARLRAEKTGRKTKARAR